MNSPNGIDKDDILDDPIFGFYDDAIEYLKQEWNIGLKNTSIKTGGAKNIAELEKNLTLTKKLSSLSQSSRDLGNHELMNFIGEHEYVFYLIVGLIINFDLEFNFEGKDLLDKKSDINGIFGPPLSKLYASKVFAYLKLSKQPVTKENFKKLYFQFSGLDIKFTQLYFQKICDLYELFFDTKNSKNILYLHNLGKNNKTNFSSTNLTILQQRQENIEGKYVDILKNFITSQPVDKSKFYQRKNEYIYPILLGKDITDLFKLNENKDYNPQDQFLPTDATLTKLLTHHTYFSKVYDELFFNPFIFGKDHPKGGTFGQKKLKEILEGVQKHIKNTSTTDTYSDIISYLQIREENAGEKRNIIFIVPQKYLSMDRKKLLGFKILPRAKAPEFKILPEQEKDYQTLVSNLKLSENEILVPCNYLCLVYDAQNQVLISSYALDENAVSQRRFFINTNQISSIEK